MERQKVWKLTMYLDMDAWFVTLVNFNFCSLPILPFFTPTKHSKLSHKPFNIKASLFINVIKKVSHFKGASLIRKHGWSSCCNYPCNLWSERRSIWCTWWLPHQGSLLFLLLFGGYAFIFTLDLLSPSQHVYDIIIFY